MGFEELKSKLVKLGEDTVNTMQKMGENVQLTSKLSTEKKALDGLFAQLGTAVFDKLQDSPLEGFEEQFEAIKSAKSVIADLEEQVQKLKGTVVCPGCGKEAFRGEAFCSACGAKLPEVAPEPEEVDEEAGEAAEDVTRAAGEAAEGAEKVKKDAAEVGREVGDFLNDAAEKARDFFGNVADKAGAFIDGVTAQIQKDKESGEEKEGEDLKETVEETVKEAGEAAKEAAETVAEKAEEAAADDAPKAEA